MKNNTIEDIEEYAKDSQTKEKPTAQNYAEGTKVGWTLPAKWWNWLMNAFTKRFRQTKATVDSMYEELKNLMYPMVPGENEENNQCKIRVIDSIEEISAKVTTNTSNISKNTSAIDTEKRGRIAAIEQEQNSRTQQDNILDSKISSLSSKVDTNTENIAKMQSRISTLQCNIYNSIITNETKTLSSIDWGTLLSDLKNKGIPTGVHLGDLLTYRDSGYSYNFLVVDIDYLTSYELYPGSYNTHNIVLMSVGGSIALWNGDTAVIGPVDYNNSGIKQTINDGFANKWIKALDSVFAVKNSITTGVYVPKDSESNQLSESISEYITFPCTMAQLVGTELKGVCVSAPFDTQLKAFTTSIRNSSFTQQFKLFRERGIGCYINAIRRSSGLGNKNTYLEGFLGTMDIVYAGVNNSLVGALSILYTASPSSTNDYQKIIVKGVGAHATTGYPDDTWYPQFFIINPDHLKAR